MLPSEETNSLTNEVDILKPTTSINIEIVRKQMY